MPILAIKLGFYVIVLMGISLIALLSDYKKYDELRNGMILIVMLWLIAGLMRLGAWILL